jgi:hypothetical protein
VTGTDFEDVDLDRLADYVGGALDGTPDADAVANLIAIDSRWTRAHAALVAADALVRADLAMFADEPAAMPDDVAARLDAALAAEPPPIGAPSSDTTPSGAPEGDKPHLSVLPGGRAVPTPTPPRRRWRAVVGVAAAAVVLGIGAVSLAPQLRQNANTTASRGGVGSSNAEGVPAAPPMSAPSYAYGQSGSPGLNASGSDYTAETLAALGHQPVAAQGGDTAKSNRPDAMDAPSQPALPLAAVPETLRPLAQPDARDGCVKAILKEYGGTATLLDYAQYQGSPALVVLLDGAHGVTGRKWVVVVGPRCGNGGAIADQRYSAQIR